MYVFVLYDNVTVQRLLKTRMGFDYVVLYSNVDCVLLSPPIGNSIAEKGTGELSKIGWHGKLTIFTSVYSTFKRALGPIDMDSYMYPASDNIFEKRIEWFTNWLFMKWKKKKFWN